MYAAAYIGCMDLHAIEACLYGIAGRLPELVHHLHMLTPSYMQIKARGSRAASVLQETAAMFAPQPCMQIGRDMYTRMCIKPDHAPGHA